jgi:hypothetical protein
MARSGRSQPLRKRFSSFGDIDRGEVAALATPPPSTAELIRHVLEQHERSP